MARSTRLVILIKILEFKKLKVRKASFFVLHTLVLYYIIIPLYSTINGYKKSRNKYQKRLDKRALAIKPNMLFVKLSG